MAKVSLNNIGSAYGSIGALNANFDEIETAFDKTLSRDGTGPNQMEANLDMNSNDILNAKNIYVDGLYIDGVEVESTEFVNIPSTVQTFEFTGEAAQTTYSVAPYTPVDQNVEVYVDGLYILPSLVTVNSDVVTFPALTGGEEVVIKVYLREIAGDLQQNTPIVYVYNYVIDGSLDDTAAVEAAHTQANLLNSPVSYAGVDVVYIQANAQIAVKTSVDWGDCELSILGGYNEFPSYSTFNKMFIVTNDDTPLVTLTNQTTSGALTEGSRNPTLGIVERHAYAQIEAPFLVPNRAKTGTMNYSQSFKVNRYGIVSMPLAKDLSAYNGQLTVKYRKTPINRLVIKGLNVREGAWNNQIIYQVERCNVKFENVSVLPDYSSDALYRNTCQLLNFQNVSDIEIDGFISTGRPNDPGYSGYGVSIYGGADIITKNMNAITGWGFTGTNRINNWKIKDCVINRVDVHDGAFNVFVENCEFHDVGLVYGWGGGVLSVKNCRLNNCAAVSVRSDYGGSFFGNIVIDDIDVTHNNTSRYYVFDAQRYKFGASTAVYTPREIFISRIRRSLNTPSSSAEIQPFDIQVDPTASGVVYAPRRIIIKDIDGKEGGVFGWRFDVNNMEGAPDNYNVTWVYVENVHMPVAANGTTSGCLDYPNTKTVTNKVQLRVFFTNVWNIGVVSTLESTGQQWTVTGGSINVLDVHPSSPYANVVINGAKLTNPSTSFTNPKIGSNQSGNASYTLLKDCEIGANYDLSLVAVFQGCTIRNTASPLLPTGVSSYDVFNGWVKRGTVKGVQNASENGPEVVIEDATSVSLTTNNIPVIRAASAVTCTLPTSPQIGMKRTVIVGNNRTDNIIDRNGSNIMGLAENMTIDSATATVTLQFTNSTLGWRIV